MYLIIDGQFKNLISKIIVVILIVLGIVVIYNLYIGDDEPIDLNKTKQYLVSDVED